jgi:hypothetical protein
MQEKETTKNDKKISHQVLIYFISKALASSKKYYLDMEKICYSVVMSAQKLYHYFEAHRVRVLTNQQWNYQSTYLTLKKEVLLSHKL